MAGTIRSTADVQQALAERDPASIDEAVAICFRLNHEWWPLEVNTITESHALYCWRCLRVRIGGAEFWPSGRNE